MRAISTMHETALIVGDQGQDGKLLTEALSARKVRVLGVDKGGLPDITQPLAVLEWVKSTQPTEIYHLAAIHNSSEERENTGFQSFEDLYRINFFSLIYFLDAIKLHSPKTRLFFAASSHVFGAPENEVQNEETPLRPDSVYGMTKVSGLQACQYYREKFGVFASTGILYTHESRYREEKFLSRKVIQTAREIKAGRQNKLVLGDLNAPIDWGYAPDYVEAMQQILQQPQGGEFVIATGIGHTVRDYVQAVFSELEMDYTRYVEEKPGILHRKSVSRIGNPSKLQRMTGWKPSVDFKGMVKLLLQS